MLSLIATKLGDLVPSTWVDEMTRRGEEVRLFREYYDGEHRLKLTAEMKNMLQITDERLDRYNANYCELVVNSMADRLTVDGIEVTSETGGAALELAEFLRARLPGGENAEALAAELVAQFGLKGEAESDEAQEWADALLERNRFDGLQIEVREALLRDGETYIMGQYHDGGANDPGYAMLMQEAAWDGETGVLVVYDRQGKTVVAGVKVWLEGDDKLVNFYYGDRLEKFFYDSGQPAEGMTEAIPPSLKEKQNKEGGYRILTTRDSGSVGVPIIHFSNKGGIRGKSELVNVIPLQDSLNRTLHSMVMTAELTAFSILAIFGFEHDGGMTPGMILSTTIEDWIGEGEDKIRAFAAMLSARRVERIESGEIAPLIEQCEFLIGQIGTITSTPVPSMMGGDSQSGEALKQRDTRLLGKIQRAQTQVGNKWEDVIRLAWRLERVFGAKALPDLVKVSTQWKGAEIRNDTEIRETAKLVREWGFEREALRILSKTSIIQYTDVEIDRLMTEKQGDTDRALQGIGAGLPSLEAAGAALGAPVAV